MRPSQEGALDHVPGAYSPVTSLALDCPETLLEPKMERLIPPSRQGGKHGA